MLWRVVALWGATALVGTAAAGCSSSSSAGPTLPACPIDASIATFTFPDAALGDAGGTALSCGTCLNDSCVAYVQACDNDCSCLETTRNVLECGQEGGTVASCAAMYASNDSNFNALALCIYEMCTDPCALNGVIDGGEGDALPATDAPSADAGETGTPADGATSSDATAPDAAPADATTLSDAAAD
jgi:hypothetical protein